MGAIKTVETAYGTVDAAVLAQLHQSFVPSDLLAAVDAIDARDDVSETRRMWLRSSLLRLYGMASHLIIGAPLTVSAKEPVWQLAEEIADELDASPGHLPEITELVDRLGRLRPPDK
jgi:hypothetical protein